MARKRYSDEDILAVLLKIKAALSFVMEFAVNICPVKN